MIEEIIQTNIDPSRPYDGDWVPAENISREQWQRAVEALTQCIRQRAGRPAFGFGDAEVSVHYHKALRDFAALARERLGM